MKTKYICLLALLAYSGLEEVQAIQHRKPFKLGEDTIDFDEEADQEPVKEETKPKASFAQLVANDNELLKDFDKVLLSASKNSGQGSLSVEMGKAQATNLFDSLKEVNENVKQEYDLIETERDGEQKKAFYSKVKTLQKKIPLMMQLWKKLDLDKTDMDKDMVQIKKDLMQIKDKDQIDFKQTQVGSYDESPTVVVPKSELDQF